MATSCLLDSNVRCPALDAAPYAAWLVLGESMRMNRIN